MVYEIIMKREAAVTLQHVEEASQKVEVALSQKSKESKSVIELKRELVELQKEIEEAHEVRAQCRRQCVHKCKRM